MKTYIKILYYILFQVLKGLTYLREKHQIMHRGKYCIERFDCNHVDQVRSHVKDYQISISCFPSWCAAFKEGEQRLVGWESE